MNVRLLDAPDLTSDPIAAESALLDQLSQPVARLWQAPLSLVVPRNYCTQAGFEAVRARFAAQVCPVYVRPSGGGLVPQGPGILNLSLAYTVPARVAVRPEPVYLHLCELLRAPLAALGVPTHWQEVEGSFCDGRFNLACGDGAQARKIAGTAQYWRRVRGDGRAPGHYAVLAHAVLLVDVDLEAAHERANAFEQALGTGRRYRVDRTTSVARMLGVSGGEDFRAELRQRLGDVVSRAQPPVLGSR